MNKLLAVLTIGDGKNCEWIESLLQHPAISYDIIDISQCNWLDICLSKDYKIFLLRAPGLTNMQKQMFDERVEVLSRLCHKQIYPSFEEIRIYENKKFLAYWLQAQGIPSPQTTVCYDLDDAMRFVSTASFPLVGKINIGASGKGVKILDTRIDAINYVKKAFSVGLKPYIGPNFRTSSLIQKAKNVVSNFGLIAKRLRSYRAISHDIQRYVIFQEYIKHEHEWRTVIIGDSYFAHKKLITGNKASGSLKKSYANPPLELIEFVHETCQRTGLSSVSIDLFETDTGFLVNEIQAFFGQSDGYQMKVDDVVGRYRFIKGQWVFDPGDYNGNMSFDLRLEHVISSLGWNGLC